MFDYKYSEVDEELKQFHAPRMASYINANDKNKYVIIFAKEDGDTRVFLKRLCVATDVVSKDGWWDYFTISQAPCKRGYWLAIVDNARVDHNGYLNIHVVPSRFIGEKEDLCENSTAWEYFSKCGMFSSLISARPCTPFNIDELKKLLIEKGIVDEEVDEIDFPLYAFRSWRDGGLSIVEIETAINTPIPHCKSDAELAAEKILSDEVAIGKYPNLAAKIQKNAWKKSAVIDHLYTLGAAYWRLLEKGVISEVNNDDMVDLFLERAEIINEYYANKKALEKLARKDARKKK